MHGNTSDFSRCIQLQRNEHVKARHFILIHGKISINIQGSDSEDRHQQLLSYKTFVHLVCKL